MFVLRPANRSRDLTLVHQQLWRLTKSLILDIINVYVYNLSV